MYFFVRLYYKRSKSKSISTYSRITKLFTVLFVYYILFYFSIHYNILLYSTFQYITIFYSLSFHKITKLNCIKCNSFLTSISLYLIYLIPRVVDAVSFSCHLFLCLIELVGVGGSGQRGWKFGGMAMVGWIIGGQ